MSVFFQVTDIEKLTKLTAIKGAEANSCVLVQVCVFPSL